MNTRPKRPYRLESEMKDSPLFSQLLLDWHRHLQDRSNSQSRAWRARLRRCIDSLDVVAEPAAHDLLQKVDRLRNAGIEPYLPAEQALLRLVPLLAWVGGHDKERSVAAAFGEPGVSARAPLSELRFRDLLQAETADALVTHLRRALPLLKRDGEVNANVLSLAEAVCEWEGARGPEIRRNWAFDYFSAAPIKATA